MIKMESTFWREKVTANGVVCNQDSFIGCTLGSTLVDLNTPVLTYEPTWHAVRLGVEGKAAGWRTLRAGRNAQISLRCHAVARKGQKRVLFYAFVTLYRDHFIDGMRNVMTRT